MYRVDLVLLLAFPVVFLRNRHDQVNERGRLTNRIKMSGAVDALFGVKLKRTIISL